MDRPPEQATEIRDGWNDIAGAIDRSCRPGVRHSFEELQSLTKRINAQGPIFFVRENGEVTNEPWFVKKITVHEYTDDKGRDDTVLYILLSPKSNATLEEQYALGEFFRDRVIGERRIVK